MTDNTIVNQKIKDELKKGNPNPIINLSTEEIIKTKFGSKGVKSIKIKPRGSSDDNFVEIYNPLKMDVVTLKAKCGYENINKTAIAEHEKNCDKCKSL